MRVLVVGAGVIGSLYAAQLSSTGVALFARGKGRKY
jgi:ketopantoate reductase